MKTKTKLQKQRDKQSKQALKVSHGTEYKNGKISKAWVILDGRIR